MVTLIKVNGKIINRLPVEPKEVNALCAIPNCPKVNVGGAWFEFANLSDKKSEELRGLPCMICPYPHPEPSAA